MQRFAKIKEFVRTADAGGSEFEGVSKVYAAHFLVTQDRFGVAFRNYATFVNNVSAVTDPQGFLHIVIGDQHAYAYLFEMADYSLNITH